MSTFLSDREIAAELHISWQQVQERCRTGQWPHQRFGRKYFFTPDHLAQIVGLCEVKRVTTPAQTWGRKTRRAS